MVSNSTLRSLLFVLLVHLKQNDVFVNAMASHSPNRNSHPPLSQSKSSNIDQYNGLSLYDRRCIFKSFLSTTSNAAAVAVAATVAAGVVTVISSSPEIANAIPEQKSYSSNARNMERLSSGDSSGGSTYNNSPESPVAAKRRAMVGCKVSSSRIEASRLDGDNNSVINEKDCNMRVMGGDSEFMLKALRNLDCPTCPYGINGA